MTSSSTPASGSVNRLGGILLILFVLCFGAVGAVTAVLSVQAFLEKDFGKGAFLGIFALTFGGFGFGTIGFMVAGRKNARQALELRAAFPSEPWKWREDWASGCARSPAKSTMLFAWGFSILWNLISTPLLFVLPPEILGKENYAALLGLLFPLIGIGLLVWAVRETLEWKKFGQSVFRLNSVPGVIGGEISGSVEIPASFDAGQRFDVSLSCINRKRTGSGKNSSTSETILWQEKSESVGLLARPEAMGSGIPVRFGIPYECRQCDDADPDNRILWRLEAHAAVPGVDFDAKFEVPVFRTAVSRPPVPGAARVEDLPATYQPSTSAGITFDVGPTGGTVVIVAPPRPAGSIAAMTAFLLVWTGIIVLMIHLGAPMLFPIIFGIFDLLLMYGVMQLAVGRNRILIEGSTVTLDNSLAGLSFKTSIPAAEIESIAPSIGMQSGRSLFYSVVITRRGGKQATLRVALREKHDAEWLAAEIRRRIGMYEHDAASNTMSQRKPEDE